METFVVLDDGYSSFHGGNVSQPSKSKNEKHPMADNVL